MPNLPKRTRGTPRGAVQELSAADGTLHVLSAGDLADIDITPADVLSAIECAYRTLAAGRSDNPRRLTVRPRDGHSVSSAMLGRDGFHQVVAVRTTYKHGLDGPRAQQRAYTALTLYDDATGRPMVMMDCARIGALRTPAVTALLARECARPGARSALLIGTGTQGRGTLPFLLTTLPDLDRLMLYGTHPAGIAAVREALRARAPDRDLEVVGDLRAAAGQADVVVAAAGARSRAAVEGEWLRPGTLSVLVGHGLAPSALHRADRVVATSETQMRATATDLADAEGRLPAVDTEFPPVLAGITVGRHSPEERVFAYNSSLVVADIPLGLRFARLAVARGLGTRVPLWR
ncbi:ornithine cyclodeaminase family protein [Streptomyces sp. MST-110588]|nr:ornithine cyclodeaminase family protein [Streptomyces sp. MST-110588]